MIAGISLSIICFGLAIRSGWLAARGKGRMSRAGGMLGFLGWTAVAASLLLISRSFLDAQGTLIPELIVGVLIAMWVAIDPSARAGSRCIGLRSLVAVATLGLSALMIFWWQLGPMPNNHPILFVDITGRIREADMRWGYLGQPEKSVRVTLQEVNVGAPTSLAQPMEFYGDLLSIRYRKITPHWALAFLGFPPLIWIDGLRGEFLDPHKAAEIPALFQNFDSHSSQLSGPWLARLRQLWRQVFYGQQIWWLASASIESQSFALVNEHGKPNQGTFVVLAGPTALFWQREQKEPALSVAHDSAGQPQIDSKPGAEASASP